MKKALLSLALALGAVPSALAVIAQAGGTTLPVRTFGPYYVAQAYPVIEDVHQEGACKGNLEIQPNRVWSGASNTTGATNSKAVGGVLALKASSKGILDFNAFATCPEGESSPFVQSYRLIKRIPGSNKCPSTYVPQTFYQFGSGVRTWWTLIYTQPGTRFTLELTVRCLDTLGRPKLHIDRYIWEVVASFESLDNVIDVLHTNALCTTEVPCIASEDVYHALKGSVKKLQEAYEGGTQFEQQNRLFEAEALIITYGCFVDCFIAEDVFSAAFPPANSMQFGYYGFTGIIDTLENPCACKILVDLEAIGDCYDITSR
ncbi:MAG: hypothetical protein K6T59_18680 [Bryobacteraceae bacterium]|nr:hypothetical protein [Bryobacteraceae bacterium]